MLISLSNGRIYLWTPDDISAALRTFLHDHLSLRQRQSLIGLPLVATVDLQTCRILPPISFNASQDIWRALKQLDHDKMVEHLHDYVQQQRQPYLQQPHQAEEDSHHVAQQVLLYGGLALSVLALFFSGGSAAVCASFMLANLGVGVVSCGRAIILVESLIKEGQDNLRQFAFSSAEAMLRINQITGRINFHQYQSFRALGQIRRFFRDLVAITRRQALKMVPRGYELAAFGHAGEQAELMLINRGEGRFGGYQLAPLTGDRAFQDGWGTVRLGDFTFDADHLVLADGQRVQLVVEDYRQLPAQTQAFITYDGPLSTRFRRYCQHLSRQGHRAELLTKAETFIKENAFTAIECRVLLYWVESEGYREMRHYLLVAEKEGTRYVVDLATEKLAFLKIPTMSQPFIQSEQQWLTAFYQAESDTPIRYQTFASIDATFAYRREEWPQIKE
ncbi:MAG: hypothetical protein ACR5LG_08500 [Sodalis sp. (in: enterobacteria)]|uniref:hypothetical protein n=1 Tax=Sodalis sp. (in: enterobacteria) TaxID=1898979 RepID=UPI003F339FCD